MKATKLGDVAKFIRGITFKPSEKCDPFDPDAVACMRTKNVQAILDQSDLIGVPRSLVKNEDKIIRNGDILVSSANSWNLVGKCCWVPPLDYDAAAGGFISILRGDGEKTLPRYLYHWFSAPFIQEVVRSFGNQTTNISNLNQKRCLSLTIPLPPLAEQKRIAAILDAADELRTKRRESLAQLDALLQSTFLDMFGDPVTNPKGWDMTYLPKISTAFSDGPFGSNLKSSHYVEEGVRVIRLQNIGVGVMIDDDLTYISEEHYESLPRNHCIPGDIIIGTLGEPNLRACVIHKDLKRSLNKADCLRLRLDGSVANNDFVCWLLNSEPLVNRALSLVRGQTRGRISLGRIKTLPIPLPPRSLQMDFSALLTRITGQKDRYLAQLTELDTLFAALQSRAFRGEL